jgi:chromosome condensin MukBEF MukE localization factor
MRRIFYITLGVTVGVIAVRRLTKLAESLSPDSMAASAAAAITSFVDDVREGMAEREAQLRTALEYNPDGAAGQDPAASGTL